MGFKYWKKGEKGFSSNVLICRERMNEPTQLNSGYKQGHNFLNFTNQSRGISAVDHCAYTNGGCCQLPAQPPSPLTS